MTGLNLAHVQGLITALRALDEVQAVDLDPGRINRLPGIWVRIAQVETVTYGGDDRIGVELHLAVAEKDHNRAWLSLQALYNAVLNVITPSGPITTVNLNMPDRPGLPCLVVPFDLVP